MSSGVGDKDAREVGGHGESALTPPVAPAAARSLAHRQSAFADLASVGASMWAFASVAWAVSPQAPLPGLGAALVVGCVLAAKVWSERDDDAPGSFEASAEPARRLRAQAVYAVCALWLLLAGPALVAPPALLVLAGFQVWFVARRGGRGMRDLAAFNAGFVIALAASDPRLAGAPRVAFVAGGLHSLLVERGLRRAADQAGRVPGQRPLAHAVWASVGAATAALALGAAAAVTYLLWRGWPEGAAALPAGGAPARVGRGSGATGVEAVESLFGIAETLDRLVEPVLAFVAALLVGLALLWVTERVLVWRALRQRRGRSPTRSMQADEPLDEGELGAGPRLDLDPLAEPLDPELAALLHAAGGAQRHGDPASWRALSRAWLGYEEALAERGLPRASCEGVREHAARIASPAAADAARLFAHARYGRSPVDDASVARLRGATERALASLASRRPPPP